MEIDALYQEVILDHYRNPKNKKLLENFSLKVHHVNPSCGDEQDITIIRSGNMLEKIGWEGVGCSISQASTSMMCELVEGNEIDQVKSLIDTFSHMISSKGEDFGDEAVLVDAVALNGVSKFPARVKCALLGWMALKDAILQSEER